jgi:hypothetical protein
LKISPSGTSTRRFSSIRVVVKVPGGAWRCTLASDIFTAPLGNCLMIVGTGSATIAFASGIFATVFLRSAGNR